MKFSTKSFFIWGIILILYFGIAPKSLAQELYQSKTLKINQINPHIFVHVSFLEYQGSDVPCNGMIVLEGNQVLIFDTPTNDSASAELIGWIEKDLKAKIKGVVVTHFHNDCLGGLRAFHDKKIPSYAHAKTLEFARKEGYTLPQHPFEQNYTLKLGKEKVQLQFFGEGHTRDNIVGYIPSEKALFGGCLIKEVNAGKGFLGDANVSEWSNTVTKIKITYPDLQIVVPGHGLWGGTALLDYTIKLFKQE